MRRRAGAHYQLQTTSSTAIVSRPCPSSTPRGLDQIAVSSQAGSAKSAGSEGYNDQVQARRSSLWPPHFMKCFLMIKGDKNDSGEEGNQQSSYSPGSIPGRKSSELSPLVSLFLFFSSDRTSDNTRGYCAPTAPPLSSSFSYMLVFEASL